MKLVDVNDHFLNGLKGHESSSLGIINPFFVNLNMFFESRFNWIDDLSFFFKLLGYLNCHLYY